jgi:hypothetical protein
VLVGAEQDGGDLADQPRQPAGGEQQYSTVITSQKVSGM